MSALEKYHIHEYERSASNIKIYRCIHPRCKHYWFREYLIGKEALCHKCKNPFMLSKIQLKNKWPVCDFCSKSPKAKELIMAKEAAFDALSEILGHSPDETMQDPFTKDINI